MLLYTALSLAGLALAVPFSGSNQRVRAIPKRDDSSINASECASPCEIYFHPVTTTMTVSASPETMDIDGIDHPVTVTFTPLTTSTTLQPAPQTVENSDPAGTPTVAINPVDLGSVTLYGSSRNYNWNVAAQAQLVTQPHPYLLSHGVNPYLLDNNCAFVTMAKLLNMGLHPFVDMVGEMQNADRGIDTDDVQRILRGLQKEQFMLTYFEFLQSHDDRHTLAEKFNAYDNSGLLGVGYMRDDGSGHVVVYRKRERMFYDYQTTWLPRGTLRDGGNGPFIEELMRPRWLRAAGRFSTGFVFAIVDLS